MHILMFVDMEGVSQIRDYRELWAAFPEFWTDGREKTTADALAAAAGLLEGGASQITVCALHGPVPVPVIETCRLPDQATWNDELAVRRQLSNGERFDGIFMVGWHARCGTRNGFLSHTEGINLRVAIDGKPVTECHLAAWRAGVPLLGITGDAALQPQLDGALQGVPYLAVKKASSRAAAEPLFAPDESATAIQAFARWSIEHTRERIPPPLPERFTLQVSMRPDLIDRVDGLHGIRRTSPAVLAMSVTDWWYEAEPAINAAMIASFTPWRAAAHGLDITSIESLEHQDERRLARFRDFLRSWAESDEAEWLM